jgi:catechol 2,3-dioxygenase-like lactoylglutathione lyase family enzyme
MAVTRIARVAFTTADADGLAAFYVAAFGFERIGVEERREQRFGRLMGIEGVEARAIVLRLGQQILELVAFAEPGMPYPPEVSGNDPRFQHIAIVVSDMKAAYARLLGCRGWTPITSPAPQRLPASSGGVTAFKFRDPEGHPLELLAFPPGKAPPVWRGSGESGPCLGIDHSAITVADTARSVDFTERLLGLSVAGRSLNHGGEQERLDGVPNAVVEVTALAPSSLEPPHLELLCYRSPFRDAAAVPRSNDIAATRLVLETDPLPELVVQLVAAKVRFISAGIQGRPAAALIRDPDGHALLLRGW